MKTFNKLLIVVEYSMLAFLLVGLVGCTEGIRVENQNSPLGEITYKGHVYLYARMIGQGLVHSETCPCKGVKP